MFASPTLALEEAQAFSSVIHVRTTHAMTYPLTRNLVGSWKLCLEPHGA